MKLRRELFGCVTTFHKRFRPEDFEYSTKSDAFEQ